MIINKVLSVGVATAPVLLWTNPSPNSSIYGRTLTLDSGFKAYLIEFKQSTSSVYRTNIGIAFVPFGEETRYAAYIQPSDYSGSLQTFRRAITASDGTVIIGNGYSSGSDISPSVCIPLRIWGVSWAL